MTLINIIKSYVHRNLGHASLLIKDTYKKPIIMTDPWITGSNYWRSWWLQNYPSEKTLSEISNIPFVYITHEHPDHFHTLFKNV